eukprot:TRINITY_DN3833_c0_g1_i2.p1 TRINITY_DN3833_c0_g1~~TRINITY_DN3833_c0_g1_i2.p1  ORF type:complete len:330 (+),score=22.56 TRINITY_DN3833_c0_g1_i2:80-1069(+)
MYFSSYLVSLFVFADAAVYYIDDFGTCQHWEYDNVDTWSLLQCSSVNYCGIGRYQNPENIQTWVNKPSLPRLIFNGYEPQFNMPFLNNGHTIVGIMDNSSSICVYDGTCFQAQSFHWHSKSEETVAGVGDSASLHIVHKLSSPPTNTSVPDGKVAYAVLGFLIIIQDTDVPFWTEIIGGLKNIQTPNSKTTINFPGFEQIFSQLVKNDNDGYWNFPGSLTTPPCTEIIDWSIMMQPLYIGKSQWNILNDFLVTLTDSTFPGRSNTRPVQRKQWYQRRVLFFFFFFFFFLTFKSIYKIILHRNTKTPAKINDPHLSLPFEKSNPVSPPAR